MCRVCVNSSGRWAPVSSSMKAWMALHGVVCNTSVISRFPSNSNTRQAAPMLFSHKFKFLAVCSGWRAQAHKVHGHQQNEGISSHTLKGACASTKCIPPHVSDLRPTTACATRGRTLRPCYHHLVHRGTNFRVPHPG